MKLYLLFIFFNISKAFNLCVVGGNSGLGREIIYQGISANKKILALSNSSTQIEYPYRGGGLDIKPTNRYIIRKKIILYQRNVKKAKNKQEKIIRKYGKKYNINTFILRPKALSYGQNMYSIKSRQRLAKEILEYLYII